MLLKEQKRRKILENPCHRCSLTLPLICKERTFQINHVHDTGRILWGYWWRLPWGIHFDGSEVGTAGPKCLHLGQPITQIIHLLSFLSSPLHWDQKLFPLISHKWHRPAQLIIIQPLWLDWLGWEYTDQFACVFHPQQLQPLPCSLRPLTPAVGSIRLRALWEWMLELSLVASVADCMMIISNI